MMKQLIIMLFMASSIYGFAQKATPEEYISKYAATAQREMQRSGVPASITLAQGILESESGNSVLANKSNNHFGIKCRSDWQGAKVYHDDDYRQECFRKYETVEQSYIDHSDFLKNNQRYASLFLLAPTDYKGWAKGLKKAGYATNPVYAQKLIDLIEKYALQNYDVSTNESAAVVNSNQRAKPPVMAPSVDEEGKEPTTPPRAQIEKPYNSIVYINQTKAVYIQAGTSLLATAEKYDVAFNRLLEFNDLTKSNEDILLNDAIIFLQRKRKQGAVNTHIVQPNETLHSIAQAEGIRLEQLLAYNNLKKNEQPMVGEVLALNGKVTAKPKIITK